MTYEIPLEAGKIREFARATQSRDDHFQGPDAIITPTFLTTAGFFWQTGFPDMVARANSWTLPVSTRTS